MRRQKAIFILVVTVFIAAAVIGFVMWPKQYSVGQHLSQTTVFWNDHEAFLFLTLNTTGRSQNVFQQKLAQTRYSYLALLLGGYIDFSKQDVIAYHLLPSAQLDRFALPEHTAIFGSWSLPDGHLQLTPPASAITIGLRWDGEKFVSVEAGESAKVQPKPVAAEDTKLSADDVDGNDDAEGLAYLPKTQRKIFKDAGWHYKFLTGYEGEGHGATLPIELAGSTFNLAIESAPRLDFLEMGTKSIRLASNKMSSQMLWSRSGWREVSKQDYVAQQRQYGRNPRTQRTSLFSSAWLLLIALALLWRFGSWIHVLFTFATMKQRVLKNMATSFSFPPATPAQFPALDLEALDRCTREFEGMGFVRLLDFSLVSDSPNNPPSFCRLFAHTRHHCFGEVTQIFPRGKAPLPLRGSMQSCLQNGWTLGFSNRKPMAASSLLRRAKAIGVCMPEASPSELLPAFLKMREQVCLDLGIQTVNDDTLEAYITKVQRTCSEIREAVQGKNFAKGVPEVYLRKLSMIKTKPEYIWLGDYPKEAERRKQGFNTFAAGAR